MSPLDLYIMQNQLDNSIPQTLELGLKQKYVTLKPADIFLLLGSLRCHNDD